MVRFTLSLQTRGGGERVIELALLSLTVLAGTLQFRVLETMWLWKASVVTTEYGHWLAVVPLVLAGVLWRRTGLGPQTYAASALALIAAALLLVPLAQLQLGLPQWQDQMSRTFASPLPPAPSLLKLWTGQPFRTLKPEVATYAQDAGQALKLHVYRAQRDEATPAPFIVVIHGGGWDSGAPDQLPELNSYLASQGYSVFAPEYRLSPRWHWPAPREDVDHAVAFIKSHAREYNIDPNRWVILGRSAGGQIAASVAMRGGDTSLKGLIAFYAPTDMNVSYEWGREDDILQSRGLVRAYMNGTPLEQAALYKDASPLQFVSAQAPPSLFFHGPRDPLVSIKHSEHLAARLSAAGARATVIEIPWATHGFDYNLSGPGGLLSTYSICYFLKAVFS